MKYLVMLGLVSFLVSCGTDVKTEEYYKANIKEAEATQKKCEDLGNLNEAQQINCQNANSALLSKRTIKEF